MERQAGHRIVRVPPRKIAETPTGHLVVVCGAALRRALGKAIPHPAGLSKPIRA